MNALMRNVKRLLIPDEIDGSVPILEGMNDEGQWVIGADLVAITEQASAGQITLADLRQEVNAFNTSDLDVLLALEAALRYVTTHNSEKNADSLKVVVHRACTLRTNPISARYIDIIKQWHAQSRS